MKILHLTESVGPHAGGLGAIALALAGQHAKAGHDVQIWTADSNQVAREVASRERLGIVGLPLLGPRSLAFSPAAIRAAGAKDDFDVVHQHGIWTLQSWITNRFRRRGTATVVAPQGSIEAWALRRSGWKKRLALAAYERQNLHGGLLQGTGVQEVESFRAFGLQGPVAILPNGVDADWVSRQVSGDEFRSRHGIPPQNRVLLFLSRIHPKKGLPLLIEALAGLRDRLEGCTLVIAGMDEGGHLDEVRQLVAAADLTGAVKFTGEVHGDQKRMAYAAADVFVLPTLSDNFAIVVTEALASGVPVITTHGAPWAELESSRSGWWVPVDAAALRQAVSSALASPGETLREMGARGRALVRSKYTWEAVARDALDLYEWLNHRARRPDFVVG